MTVTVRPYKDADAPVWASLLGNVAGRPATPQTVLEADARRGPAEFSRRWVAEGQGGPPVAGAHLYFFPFDPPGFLHASILVPPGTRGRGVGNALWKLVEGAAREAGVDGLAADVLDTDAASLAWAERRGSRQYAHRFASELDLTTFDETSHLPALKRAEAQGVTFTDLAGVDNSTLDRYLNFFADRLTETPDLAGHPRWPLAQVRETLHLDRTPRPDWLLLAVSPQGEWLGTTAMVAYPGLAYNELTAVHPSARGQGLALPLKLHAIRRARAEGLPRMRTNNHSTNAPMLRVNARLGFQARPGRFELHRTLL